MDRKIMSVILTGVILILSACSMERIKEEKLQDIDFTVLSEDEIPKELTGQIEESQKEEMKLTFSDKGYLYIVRGYGAQETSGYSIEVLELYETENAVCIETNLLGPDTTEDIIETETYPYVVVKLEDKEKYVVFD